MHGIYYIIKPLFALFLILATSAALYMGIFKAHRETATFKKKTLSGIASVLLSCCIWAVLYSHHYLGW